eukprot:scaffold244784_cov35-Tisochrysis_lutea.AAC.3
MVTGRILPVPMSWRMNPSLTLITTFVWPTETKSSFKQRMLGGLDSAKSSTSSRILRVGDFPRSSRSHGDMWIAPKRIG